MKERLRNVAIPGLWLLFSALFELVVFLFYGKGGLINGFPIAFVLGGSAAAFLYNRFYSEKEMSYDIDILKKNIMIFEDSAPVPLTCDGKTVMFEVVTGEKPHLYVYDLGLGGSEQHADGEYTRTANMVGGIFNIHRIRGKRNYYLVQWKAGIWTVAKKLVWRSA